MKRRKLNLSSKIFRYLLIFTVSIIAVLWIFQVVFIGEFYESVKTKQIKAAVNDIEENIQSEDLSYADLQTYVSNLAQNSDYCIRIYQRDNTLTNSNTENFIESIAELNRSVCGLQYESQQEIQQLYAQTVQDDGETIVYTTETFNFVMSNEDPTVDGITIGKVIEEENDKYFVIINARLSPLTETVDTIKQQLLFITLIILTLAMVIAIVISKRISKPIQEINNKAKKLGEGDLDIHFDGKGYIEIEELNDTLNYAVEELSKVESFRRELIANMSHDLRTPLTMISSYSEAIRDLPGEDTKENIQVIIDECQRLTNLVNNILDLSKLQSKNEKLNIERINLTEILQVITARFNTLMESEGYQIVFESNDAQDVYVNGDVVRLKQVIYNIVGNAMHYTGKDKKVYIRMVEKQNKVRVEIEDTGKGIKQEDIPYVWDRYYKLPTNHKRQEVATGLGLSIVRNILEMHGVEYGVTSAKGKGATFYFEFKIVE